MSGCVKNQVSATWIPVKRELLLSYLGMIRALQPRGLICHPHFHIGQNTRDWPSSDQGHMLQLYLCKFFHLLHNVTCTRRYYQLGRWHWGGKLGNTRALQLDTEQAMQVSRLHSACRHISKSCCSVCSTLPLQASASSMAPYLKLRLLAPCLVTPLLHTAWPADPLAWSNVPPSCPSHSSCSNPVSIPWLPSSARLPVPSLLLNLNRNQNS